MERDLTNKIIIIARIYSIDEKKINIRVRKKDEYIYTSMILLLTRY